LSANGIAGDLIEWIRNFRRKRSRCTRINESYSDCVSISSGVIQGSVLGPLIFLLYMGLNDVTDIAFLIVTVYLNYTLTTLNRTLFKTVQATSVISSDS